MRELVIILKSSVLCVKVPRKVGELIRKKLNGMGVLNRSFEIGKNDVYLYFPITRDLSGYELEELKKIGEIEIVKRKLERCKSRPRSFLDVLKRELNEEELEFIRRSFDIIGDIAIIEVPKEVSHLKHKIGDAILQVHKNIRTVLAKVGKVDSEFRLRKLEHIAGEKKTETIHREHGCVFVLDVSKVYFSPRLGTEHWRVASQVKEGEIVVDMFTGIGPFAILIAKRVDTTVYAIDKNPYAIKYLEENIKRNKLRGKVIPILGDAKQIIKEKMFGKADRVIMNLPEKAYNFIDEACLAVKPEGGIIHYYQFASDPDPEEKVVKILEEKVLQAGRKIDSILNVRKVRPYAPHEWQIVVDALIH